MVLAGALTVLLANAFQLTGEAIGVFFTLQIPRDSLRSTLRQSLFAVLSFLLGAVYIVGGMATLSASPVTHFFFVVATAYLLFFIAATTSNYGAAAGFIFMVASALPLWDLPGSENLKVAGALHILLSIFIGMGCTVAVECVYRAFPSQDLIVAGVADRLGAVARALAALGENRRLHAGTRARVLQYAFVGSSTLRQQLIRSGPSPAVRARAGAVVSMTSRLVELCAVTLREREVSTGRDRERLRLLSAHIRYQAAAIRALTKAGRMGEAALPAFDSKAEEPSGLFALGEMERSARLLSVIPNAFLQARESRKTAVVKIPRPPQGKLWGLLTPDAYKPVNFLFALRGCLAASLCYLIYNSLAWPGISTSFVTCVITALGSVGASRQKQALRIAGAVIGGLLISLPAQALLLPRMDSISAFLLFFVLVTAFAAWVATGSQRLAYCGVQIALAFDLINTQEPYRQISLAVARDRVVGVLLGLVAMWLVFDRIAPVRASGQMKLLLLGTLTGLGELMDAVGELSGKESGRGALRCETLRDKLNNDLSTMNGEADAVHFEYGPDRARQLRERERMRAMQPPMRSLFLLAITIWEAGLLPNPYKDTSAAELFLKRVGTAFRTLAALVSHPVKVGWPGESAELRAAVAAAQEALEGMEDQPSALRELCGTLFFSLRALERAASGLPRF